jgi:hypothetical protein
LLRRWLLQWRLRWLLLRLLLRMLLRMQRRLRGGIAPTIGGLCVPCCEPFGQHENFLCAPTPQSLDFREFYVTQTHDVLKFMHPGLGNRVHVHLLLLSPRGSNDFEGVLFSLGAAQCHTQLLDLRVVT